MSIADQPAFPVDPRGHIDAMGYGVAGLTKREHFAALAMQGLCASNAYAESTIADIAVKQADALLAALEKSAND